MNFYAKEFEELNITELYEILKSRCEVFMLRQNIICQDMDDVDYKSRHIFLWENDRVIAYARAFYDGENTVKIGRVLTLRHGEGYGRKIMTETLKDITENMKCKKILLNSQKHAIGFYEKFGFKTVSNEFLEEGVVHVTMELVI